MLAEETLILLWLLNTSKNYRSQRFVW